MCFAYDARPPDLPADLAPIAGGAGAELLELESADGTRFSASLAESPEPRGKAVVVLPDIRGLYPFYTELAERFASAGHHAIAIDYFGRTAGLGPRGEDFDFWPHVEQTRPWTVQADIAAALAALRERTGAERVSTVGFCFGGTQSFLAATREELALDGVIGFYGGLNPERWGEHSPIHRAREMRGPVLGLYGGADEGIPAEQVEAFERNLAEAGVQYEIVTYAGRPALVLRPPLRGARPRLRGRLAPGPRVPLAALLFGVLASAAGEARRLRRLRRARRRRRRPTARRRRRRRRGCPRRRPPDTTSAPASPKIASSPPRAVDAVVAAEAADDVGAAGAAEAVGARRAGDRASAR